MHYHFITGRLAEHAVRHGVEQASQKHGFAYSIQVLPITVAALMTAKWVLRHLEVPKGTDALIVPGYLEGQSEDLVESVPCEVRVGPKDVRDLPRLFGDQPDRSDYGKYSIEIVSEINHADRLEFSDLLDTAKRLQADGADLVDIGCSPGGTWSRVGEATKMLIAEGLRVSIDSFNPVEVAAACQVGAELVLSVNSSNREQAVSWGREVVVVPDTPDDWTSFQATIEYLASQSVPMRLDPILEPIGCGFVESLARYRRCRHAYPDAKMLMGIGNLTELTDVDSAGVNVVLLGICEELQIQSVLTTQVINWARSSTRECDLGRRLVHFACQQSIPPKNLSSELVLLRDPRVQEFDLGSISSLSQAVKDQNIRIFTLEDQIHAVSRGTHVWDRDPFVVMEKLLCSEVGTSINPSHAFYLGFEMAKSLTANTLGKQYTQDEALNWGFLTRDEDHHRLARTHRAPRTDGE
ncbi:MAG: DUF6513 domain-containing protein [Pirellulaceae bacterium]